VASFANHLALSLQSIHPIIIQDIQDFKIHHGFNKKGGKATFKHVLDTVLGRGDGTPLKASLVEEGIEDIFSLISLDEIAIHGLKYKDANDNDATKPHKL
jgi:hypothetical protein